jgi:hypothetical protein
VAAVDDPERVAEPRRAVLTLASLIVSVGLVGTLIALANALFYGGEANTGVAERLVVHHKIALTQDLPVSDERAITAIPGVHAFKSDERGQYVFILQGDRLVRRSVRVLRSGGAGPKQVAVDGLAGDEEVAIDDSNAPKDGLRARRKATQ